MLGISSGKAPMGLKTSVTASDKTMTVVRALAEFSAAGNAVIQTSHLTRSRLINNKYLPFNLQTINNTF